MTHVVPVRRRQHLPVGAKQPLPVPARPRMPHAAPVRMPAAPMHMPHQLRAVPTMPSAATGAALLPMRTVGVRASVSVGGWMLPVAGALLGGWLLGIPGALLGGVGGYLLAAS